MVVKCSSAGGGGGGGRLVERTAGNDCHATFSELVQVLVLKHLAKINIIILVQVNFLFTTVFNYKNCYTTTVSQKFFFEEAQTYRNAFNQKNHFSDEVLWLFRGYFCKIQKPCKQTAEEYPLRHNTHTHKFLRFIKLVQKPLGRRVAKSRE
jgi:hypothetical protein